MGIPRGCADSVVRRMRKVMPVDGDVFQELMRLLEEGTSMAQAIQKATDFKLCQADGGYLAWLAAPEAAKAHRAARGLCTYHVREVALSAAELAGLERLARFHSPLKKWFAAQDAPQPEPEPEPEAEEEWREVRAQLNRIEAKVNHLLRELG